MGALIIYMKVILAKTAGFCWGVKRAVNIVLDAKKNTNKNVYTNGPLIHNSLVIDDLKEKGIGIYKIGDKVEGPSCIVIRAHGIPPKTREQLDNEGFELINATCPHVIRAQEEVEKYSNDGYSILFAGDKNHAEIIGLLGYAKTSANVVNNLEEIKKLKMKEPVLFLAQTTFDVELFKLMKAELDKKFKNLSVADTICLATAQRQKELFEIAKISDALVVVGDETSANTKRLVSIAECTKKPVYLVQVLTDIDPKEMSKYDTVGVTAGASTPDWLSSSVVEKLEKL